MRIIDYFPNASIEGKYIVAGDIHGGSGRSFRYNMEQDVWADFATGQRGKGLEKLLSVRGDRIAPITPKKIPTSSSTVLAKRRELVRELVKEDLLPTFPITDPEVEFRMPIRPGGKLSKVWEYRNELNETCFYIARYDYAEGKEVIPYSFNGLDWIAKAWYKNRPLYNADKIKDFKKVMIVEGEKCADAVAIAFPDYLGVCWQGGSKAINKTNWTLLKEKEIVIFPDNDKAGYEAAKQIKETLPQAKILNTLRSDLDEGYDLADLVQDEFDVNQFRRIYEI